MILNPTGVIFLKYLRLIPKLRLKREAGEARGREAEAGFTRHGPSFPILICFSSRGAQIGSVTRISDSVNQSCFICGNKSDLMRKSASVPAVYRCSLAF